MSQHQQQPAEQQTPDDYSSYRATQELRSLAGSRSDAIQTAIDEVYACLARDDREAVAAHLQTLEDLLPVTRQLVYQINGELTESDIPWDGMAVLEFLEADDTNAYVQQAPRSELEALVSSVTAVGVALGDLDVSIQTEQPAYEYETRIGTRYVSPTSRARGDLDLIDRSGDLKATLCTGSQGAGKSTAVGTIVEDRIQRGHAIVDLVDFHKSENALYDIEGKPDEELQEYRQKHGLEAGFEEDYEPPEVTILAPLTHDLADSRVPFDVETDEPVVKPFTIPASDLTFKQVVMLLPHTTKTQQGYIKTAHQKLNQRGGDWTLWDLAQTVRSKTNAGEAVADRIERSLETAQQKSFIRDEDSDYQLDWEEIMSQERHVAAFTVHMIRERSDKLAIVSYLLDRLYDARQELIRRRKVQDYPPLTCVMRELHTLAPKKKAEQDAENTIEGYMIDTLSDLMALMRHVNMDIVADTQKFHQQLAPGVSSLFHRIYCFSGQKPDVRHVFRTRIDDTDPAEKVAKYPTGKCALVSGDGYRLPIEVAPPRHHHLDATTDGDGLSYRAEALQSEELRESPWSAQVPPRLTFSTRFDPREEFWTLHVNETGDPNDTVVKRVLTHLYNRWAEQHDYRQLTHKEFCTWIKSNPDPDDGQPVKGSRRRWSWKGIELK